MHASYLFRMGIWILPIVLEPVLALLMVRRRLVKQFTYFFIYCLCTPARDLVLLLLQHHLNVYSYIYWITEGFLILLQIAVLWETFWCLVPVGASFRVVATRFLRVVVACLCGMAFLLFVATLDRHGKSFEVILYLERFARVIQVVMLVVVMCFISHWGLTWRQYATGILLGSGIAGLQLVPAELRGGLQLISDQMFVWLQPVIYDIAVVIWTAYFLFPQSHPSAIPQPFNDELTGWDVVLKGFLSRQ